MKVTQPGNFPAALKIGTDICSVARIEGVYQKYGQRFADRIMTAAEQRYVFSKTRKSQFQSFAARFAAKEAVSKALGTGWNGINWKEVEVSRAPSGEPSILLHGRAAALAAKKGLDHFEVSLTHERDFAVAFVVAYGTNTTSTGPS